MRRGRWLIQHEVITHPRIITTINRNYAADEHGLPANPRDYALPGNQSPDYPWPSSLVTATCPPCSSTMLRTMDRPRPVPWPSPLVEKNGSKMRPT